ncbi:MAG: amino acid permease [Gammaproteobacteria bacterium]|nr:amino acid permease [Gammaproteobacteria bacterium]
MKIKTHVPTLSTLALVLLITGAIDSIRCLPATAWFGPPLIFFFILSAILFLIPVALVSAELSTLWFQEESGIYGWVKHAFGKRLAFLTIWLQWVNTIVWFPTILLFISSTLAYLVNPTQTNNTLFAAISTIGIFWSLTLLGLKGLHASARVASFCASIMTSFLGMELAAVHVRQIRKPQQSFPKAMFYSIILILFTMIFGSLSIAIVLPAKDINLVLGVLQICHSFLKYHHLEFIMPLLALMIFIGSTGSMINWILAPLKGMSFAATDGFMPSWLAKKTKDDVPKNLLITQACLVTLLCLSFPLLPNINTIYWFFTALSTELYMCMYVLMFIAAILIKRKFAHLPRSFHIPGGNKGYYLSCCLGLIGCALTLIIGFFPPTEALSLPHPELYKLYFGLGLLLMISPALWRMLLR